MADELISREALDRIIRRAAELQTGERDIGEGLTQADVLALGQDVGIPARYLKQALIEEQTRTAVAPATGAWGWLAGPLTVASHRVVPGDRTAVERALGRWMEEEELLQPKRRFPDRTTWEPKAGAFASIQRALGGGRRYALARALEVSTQVTQLEPGFCHVRLEADVRQQRASRLTNSGVMATAGVLVSTVLLSLGTPLPMADVIALVPGLGLTAGGVWVARSHRRENGRIQLAFEQTLDRLERGEIRPEHQLGTAEAGSRANPFVRIAEEIRKTFQI